ncbi:MAG: FIST N-terminal domain-containing protein [Desulfosarcinaceae bacterium]|jgi:hypothetical protein
MNLCVGTGTSEAHDAAAAGREAATSAMAPLGDEPAALVVVFTTPRYDLTTLIAAIRSITGDALLIGATGSGEIVEGRYMGFGAGVAVLAMTAGSYRFGMASARRIKEDLDRAGQDIVRESRAQAGSSPHSAVVLLADCMLGDLQQLVQGAYRITGPKTPLVGGAAGDELKFVATFVFHNDRIVEEGAAALWIASQTPLKVVTRHGWLPIGVPLLVTRAEGTEIIEINGRPAVDVYEEQLGLSGQLTADKFWDTSLYHPFGLIQPDGSMIIRVARTKTERGSLMIQGCVPPAGSAVQVMTGGPDSLLATTEETVAAALAPPSGTSALLTFSCAARAVIYGQRAVEEARRLQSASGAVPTFGFYCCGEFARTAGVLGTHNASLTALAL